MYCPRSVLTLVSKGQSWALPRDWWRYGPEVATLVAHWNPWQPRKNCHVQASLQTNYIRTCVCVTLKRVFYERPLLGDAARIENHKSQLSLNSFKNLPVFKILLFFSDSTYSPTNLSQLLGNCLTWSKVVNANDNHGVEACSLVHPPTPPCAHAFLCSSFTGPLKLHIRAPTLCLPGYARLRRWGTEQERQGP